MKNSLCKLLHGKSALSTSSKVNMSLPTDSRTTSLFNILLQDVVWFSGVSNMQSTCIKSVKIIRQDDKKGAIQLTCGKGFEFLCPAKCNHSASAVYLFACFNIFLIVPLKVKVESKDRETQTRKCL